MAVNYLIEEALDTPNGRFWYVAPTYSQAKMIAWRLLADQVRVLPPAMIVKKNESELYIEFINGSLIELKGADKEDNLRGVGLHGCVLDEYAVMKPNVFDEIIRPALSDYKGWAMFISTPKGYNHFWDIYKRGLDPKDTNWASFKATSYENPHVLNSEIEQAKNEIGEDLFNQEYMAEFTRMEGLVYKEWDRRIHVIPADWKPEEGSLCWRGIDFGGTNPTACLWIHVNNDGDVYVFDEYYQNEKTTSYHAGVILSRHQEYDYRLTIGDPSGKQAMLDFAQYGLYITPATRIVAGEQGWVLSGINEVKALLRVNPQNGRPKLFVTENCINFIREIEHYRWATTPKNPDMAQKDSPIKVDDHAMDAFRCFVVTYKPTRERRAKRRGVVHVQRSKITGY